MADRPLAARAASLPDVVPVHHSTIRDALGPPRPLPAPAPGLAPNTQKSSTSMTPSLPWPQFDDGAAVAAFLASPPASAHSLFGAPMLPQPTFPASPIHPSLQFAPEAEPELEAELEPEQEPEPVQGSDQAEASERGQELEQSHEAEQPEEESAPNTVHCASHDDLNFCVMVRIAVLRHLRSLRERGADAERAYRAYRDAAFPVHLDEANRRVVADPVDAARARKLLGDAIMAFIGDPEARVRLYTMRSDHGGMLSLHRMLPGSNLAKLVGVRDAASHHLAAALDRKLDEYVRACAGMDPPCIFHIPFDCEVHAAPGGIHGVFDIDRERGILRVAPAVLAETDAGVVGSMLCKRIVHKRKRTATVDAASDDENGDEGEFTPVPARPVRRRAAVAMHVVPTPPPSTRTPVVTLPILPPLPPLPPPLPLRHGSGLVSTEAAPRGAPRSVPNETRAPPPPQRPVQSNAIVAFASAAANKRENVQPKVDDSDAALEFSADVFEALGPHTARLSAGEFDKRIVIAYRRGWTVERTVAWMGVPTPPISPEPPASKPPRRRSGACPRSKRPPGYTSLEPDPSDSELSSVPSPAPDHGPQLDPDVAAPKGVACASVDELNFCVLLRVAVWRHLAALRERNDRDGDREYRAASFTIQDDGHLADQPRARQLLIDAVMALLAGPPLRVKMYAKRADHHLPLLQLGFMSPWNQLRWLVGVRDWRDAKFMPALKAKLDRYLAACTSALAPCMFRIPDGFEVRGAPAHVRGVFERTADGTALRVAPGVLDESDSTRLAGMVDLGHAPSSRKKRCGDEAGVDSKDHELADAVAQQRASRKRSRTEEHASPERSRDESNLAPEDREIANAVEQEHASRKRSRTEAEDGELASTVEQEPAPRECTRAKATDQAGVDLKTRPSTLRVSQVLVKTNWNLHVAQPRTRSPSPPPVSTPTTSFSPLPVPPVPGAELPEVIPPPVLAAHDVPRSVPNEHEATATGPQQPKKQATVVDLTKSDDEPEDVKPPEVVEDLMLQYSASVFDEVGYHAGRLPPGEFERRVRVAFGRAWTVSHAAAWIRGV
ncbi:hypothetical protein H9P43_006560 [Blastocladiella emersonii ATCC 22665]|nr:hypothetical protein H9P43_006560 [Blastocladiella emersonii ATCC 22665]